MAIRVTQEPRVTVDQASGSERVTQFPALSVDQVAGKERVTQFPLLILQSVIPGSCSSPQPPPPMAAICPPATPPSPCLCAPQLVSSITIQSLVKMARAYPDLTPVFGTSGWEQEPAISIANDVMQRFLAINMDWKFNRSFINPFLTVALQQDYIGAAPAFCPTLSTLDLGWLEQGWRQDINNTAIPKPVFALETVRDLARTSYQGVPFNVSWVPIPLAIYGTWQANTLYPTGLGAAQTPSSPIQQFIDANGNFLFLIVNGTSGSIQPVLPALTAPGSTITDGTVTWQVADPRGIAIRLAPLPAFSGIVWSMTAVYQRKPPILTSLQNTINPIPDEYAYLFRQGFLCLCKRHAGAKDWQVDYQIWEADMMKALRSADREREEAIFYPSEGITGGGPLNWPFSIGPSWPYWFGGY